MKALIEGNNLKWCGVGYLLWVGGIFDKCVCAHPTKGVYAHTFVKNAANPQQMAHSAPF